MTELWSTGVIIALEFVLTSQIYPFMLSSAFTARTIVKEKGQVPDVKTDILWALILSIGAFLVLYGFTQDWIALLAGSLFSVVLFIVYEIRGELLDAEASSAGAGSPAAA